jgi:hypothetical protein
MIRITFTTDNEGDIVRICSDKPIELYMVGCDANGDIDHVSYHEGVDIGSKIVEADLAEHPISHGRERLCGKFPAGMPPGYAYHVTKAMKRALRRRKLPT